MHLWIYQMYIVYLNNRLRIICRKHLWHKQSRHLLFRILRYVQFCQCQASRIHIHRMNRCKSIRIQNHRLHNMPYLWQLSFHRRKKRLFGTNLKLKMLYIQSIGILQSLGNWCTNMHFLQ